MSDREWSELVTTATQYYVAGRYATISGLLPVAGNLLHHAIEMYLKGALAKQAGKGLEDLRKLGHGLSKIWAEYKSHGKDSTLNEFDDVVTAINRFEEIRYPDAILNQGAQMTINIGKKASAPPVLQVGSSSSPLPHYEVWLGDVDHLIAKVLASASINPKFFTSSLMKPSARQYLTEQNEETDLTAER